MAPPSPHAAQKSNGRWKVDGEGVRWQVQVAGTLYRSGEGGEVAQIACHVAASKVCERLYASALPVHAKMTGQLFRAEGRRMLRLGPRSCQLVASVVQHRAAASANWQ